MTSSILSDKRLRPESDIALEATHLIQRMVRHILYDNCDHCRHILKENNEAGNQPAPTKTATQHNPNQQEVSITK
jgi:hypothetical protein